MDKGIRDQLRAGRYDRTDDGLYVPEKNVLVQGVFCYNIRGQEEEFSRNIVVTQGLNYVLQAAISDTAPIANWYIALFTDDVTPLAGWTAATWRGLSTEWTNYDEATRGAWTTAAVSSGGTDSFANKASFTSSGDAQTVRGAVLVSASAKNADTGILLAASRLSSDKTLATGEILDVGYGIQLTAT
jgi:hypothetical protein